MAQQRGDTWHDRAGGEDGIDGTRQGGDAWFVEGTCLFAHSVWPLPRGQRS